MSDLVGNHKVGFPHEVAQMSSIFADEASWHCVFMNKTFRSKAIDLFVSDVTGLRL